MSEEVFNELLERARDLCSTLIGYHYRSSMGESGLIFLQPGNYLSLIEYEECIERNIGKFDREYIDSYMTPIYDYGDDEAIVMKKLIELVIDECAYIAALGNGNYGAAVDIMEHFGLDPSNSLE